MLRSKAITAGRWVIFGVVVSQLARLGSNLFLTRFLLPEAFGLMAVAFSLIVGINMLSDIGIQANIVQSKRGEDPVFLRTAWTLQIIRGFVIGVGVVILSGCLVAFQRAGIPPENSVYATEMLAPIIFTLSVIPILAGFRSVNYCVAERNIDQKRRVILELLTSLIPVPFMAALILISPSVWVLVAGTVLGQVINTGASLWMFRGPENRICFDRQSVRELIGFGKWVMLSSLLGFLAMQGDKLLLGAYLTSEQLGWYAIAILFIGAADQVVRRFQSSIGFPLVAQKARVGTKEFINAYYKFRFFTDPFILAGAGVLFMVGDDFIRLMYPASYSNAGWMLQILAVRVMLLVYASQGQAFLAWGKPRFLSNIVVLRVLALFISVPLMNHYFSLQHVVWAIALAPISGILYGFLLFRREGWLDLKREFIVLPLILFGLALGAAAEQVILWAEATIGFAAIDLGGR